MGSAKLRRGPPRYVLGTRPRARASAATADASSLPNEGDPYHRITPLYGHGVVLLERTDARYESVVDLIDSFAWIDDRLAELARTDRRFLLVDTRATKGRNDPQFEVAMAPLRRRLQASFERVAVVLRSAIGRMQVERYARDDGEVLLRAFTSYEDALAWLTKE